MRVYVKELVVIEIIPEEDQKMPGLTPEQRYPSSFLEHCLVRSDNEEVQQGWKYDADMDEFYDPKDEEDGDTE